MPQPHTLQYDQQYSSSELQQPSPSQVQSSTTTDAVNPTLDIFQPFYDPAMLDLFPNGDIPDLSQFDVSPLNFECFEIDAWQMNGDMAMDAQQCGPGIDSNGNKWR